MERSVIFTPIQKEREAFKYKLRAVDPYFRVIRDLKLYIPNRYWFSGAFRVFDPYNNEVRFLRTINDFARACGLGKYFYIDDNGNVWEKNSETDEDKAIMGLDIIDDEAEEVQHIMVSALASAVNKYPELRPIINIGRER